MTTTQDALYQFGGVPVASNKYAGWWGNGVWFVDDIAGIAGNEGNNPLDAKKTIQQAVNLAGPQDTIFLRPRAIAVGAYHTHGYYTGNVIIDNALAGLNLIGTGGGGQRGWGANIQCAIEPDAGSTAATILVQAPSVSIENVMVKAISGSTGGGIGATNDTNNEVYGLTISNCGFKDFIGYTQPYGSIDLRSVNWATIQHCIFREAGTGISLVSSIAQVRDFVIRDCDFWGLPARWNAPIKLGDFSNGLIDSCRFMFGLPAAGAFNKYVYISGTIANGIMSNCYFAYSGHKFADMCSAVDAFVPAGSWGDEFETVNDDN